VSDNLLIPISGGTATAATEDVGGVHYQKMIAANEAHASFRGRGASFRMLGRAGTTPRRLLALWNAAASGIVVHVNGIAVDLYETAIKAVTVAPPILRVSRITAIPTGGSTLAKTSKDSALAGSSASISLFQDASADSTNSASALTATPVSTIAQEFAPRLITAAGYEMFDRTVLCDGADVVIRAGEGILLSADAIAAVTQEPATDFWIATIDWYEHT
jgi:hypothetical protein